MTVTSRLFPEQSAPRVPVSVLTGFLGSGKTSLLNRLLQHEDLQGTGVVINEYGDVPLDGELVGAEAGEVVTLSNGCMCCFVGDDFEAAAGSLYRNFRNREGADIRRLVVETSGLADPAPIVGTLLNSPMMASWAALDGVIATVDAMHFLDQARLHPEVANQSAFADRLVITKTDLVEPQIIREVMTGVGAYNRHGEVLMVDDACRDPNLLFGIQERDGKTSPVHVDDVFRKVAQSDGGTLHHSHSADIHTIAIVDDRPIAWPRLTAWLRSFRIPHASDLLRMKAILDIAGEPRPVVVHGVRQVLHKPTTLESWMGRKRMSRFVFIVRGAALRDRIRDSYETMVRQPVSPYCGV